MPWNIFQHLASARKPLPPQLLLSNPTNQSMATGARCRLALLWCMAAAARPFPAHSRAFGVVRDVRARAEAKRVLVPIGDGSEEIESVTIMDVLARAGAEVTCASVMDRLEVTCSRGVKIMADCNIRDCVSQSFDLIACPGGDAGARNLAHSRELRELLENQAASQKPLAAVCASPAVVLAPWGLLDGKRATCYPAKKYRDSLGQSSDDSVVVDGNTITSQGPATTMAFSLKLVEVLYGRQKADEIAQGLLYTRFHNY